MQLKEVKVDVEDLRILDKSEKVEEADREIFIILSKILSELLLRTSDRKNLTRKICLQDVRGAFSGIEIFSHSLATEAMRTTNKL